jgi:hypothetical protein
MPLMMMAYTLQYIDKSAMSYAAIFTFRAGQSSSPLKLVSCSLIPFSSLSFDLVMTIRLQSHKLGIPMARLGLLPRLPDLFPPQRLPLDEMEAESVPRKLYHAMGDQFGPDERPEEFRRAMRVEGRSGDE